MSLLNAYNRASAVFSLWIASVMLPVVLVNHDEFPLYVTGICYVLLMVIGILLSQFRTMKIKEGAWRYSDVAVYFIVPAALFVAGSLLFLFAPDTTN